MSASHVIDRLAQVVLAALMLVGLGVEIRNVRTELIATRELEQVVLHGVAGGDHVHPRPAPVREPGV